MHRSCQRGIGFLTRGSENFQSFMLQVDEWQTSSSSSSEKCPGTYGQVRRLGLGRLKKNCCVHRGHFERVGGGCGS
jgi:hypothetical protein